MQINGKPIIIRMHAIIRARQRRIAFPDQVYSTLMTGKIERFGKRGVRFISKSIICIGEDNGYEIIIKTVERR